MRSFLVLLLVFSASAAFGEIYTWNDSHGTAFYANSLNDIPARYLKKARVLDVATGKKGGLATAQPASPASPGQTAAQQAPVANPVSAPAATPAVANPLPPAAPVPEVAQPQPTQPTETRAQRRAHRRRGGGGEE